ncbi:uncharacterized protein LOC129288292 [Prosopis cineraria]|uniref:uncharacterized protein LOC129288292 n=1 Tax=Prosopis cineraria TaxID=364024 RepID=UPI00240FD0CD|nr:uncharacterized protein LOC129288292 [Prosopis cineraria]
MEEIISTKGRNNMALEKVCFSKLETMVIKNMKRLKKVWHLQFNGLKTLEVSKCERLENIIPIDMGKSLESLETLMVSDCNSVQVIFGFNSEKGIAGKTTRLRKLSLSQLSKLKQIWSRDFPENLHFHNLQLICVENCENLEYLFPFFIAMHATQLGDITIKNAGRMKEIVPYKEGSVDSPIKFEYNHFTSLVLWNLFELEGFFPQNHRLLCPLLRELDVRNCGKLKLFQAQGASGLDRVFDSELQVSMQQPFFTLEEVIGNLETLALNSEAASIILHHQFSGKRFSKLTCLVFANFEDGQATFPHWFIHSITSLKVLNVEWSSFKEIFQGKTIDEKRKFDIRTQIKELILNQLPKLRHICQEGFQIHPILEFLECLQLSSCFDLKNLVPSSVTFSHLTYLEVQHCSGLIHLITSSTARSLVKLTTMKISNCYSLEQVVAEEKDESAYEISFSSLENLELECLPNMRRFCSTNCVLNLPLLERVVVKQCPRMTIFSVRDTSTPMLQNILSKEEDEKMYWEGDLNRTIKKMFMDMVGFRGLVSLEISQCPELRELWYSHEVKLEVFGNLKRLVVHKCEFLSDVLLPLNLVHTLSNLEELEASECDSLKAVFDLSNVNGEEVIVKETIQLKRITLLHLPMLKDIWKLNYKEIVSSRETTEEEEEEEEDEEGAIRHQQPAYSIKQV